MPGIPILATTSLLCPHGGKVQITSNNVRVKSDLVALVTSGDTFVVTGCPLAQSNLSSCTQVLWPKPNLRVRVNGLPTIFFSPDAPGNCIGSPTPGPPLAVPPPMPPIGRLKGM